MSDICDPCKDGDGFGCVARIASDLSYQELNVQIHDSWIKSCTLQVSLDMLEKWNTEIWDVFEEINGTVVDLEVAMNSAIVGLKRSCIVGDV